MTASPFEAQSHGDVGLDNVEGVAMPDRLVEMVRTFIDTHHREETFYKRKRQPHKMTDEHKFGQEPLIRLRERMGERIEPPMPKPDNESGDNRRRSERK